MISDQFPPTVLAFCFQSIKGFKIDASFYDINVHEWVQVLFLTSSRNLIWIWVEIERRWMRNQVINANKKTPSNLLINVLQERTLKCPFQSYTVSLNLNVASILNIYSILLGAGLTRIIGEASSLTLSFCNLHQVANRLLHFW